MPCGVLSSTIVVPELQTWSYRFIINSFVNKNEVPYPPEAPDIAYPIVGSFITMLFDDDYKHDYYRYLYASEENRLAWPYIVKHRLLVYPRSGKYYTLNNSGENIFLLKPDDFTMLDALLQYRIDSTSVEMIDSTADVFINDSTSGTIVLMANFNSLSTELSKLIYLYLDLKINKNITHYNSEIPISTTKPLETIYELYVMDNYFEYLAANGIDPAFSCSGV